MASADNKLDVVEAKESTLVAKLLLSGGLRSSGNGLRKPVNGSGESAGFNSNGISSLACGFFFFSFLPIISATSCFALERNSSLFSCYSYHINDKL